MLTSKRRFQRFDLPLNVKFRPTHGAIEYAAAVTKNVSFDGLCLEAKDFKFIQHENLEMNVQLPKNKPSVSVFGDVAWKRQVDGKSLVGIRLKMKNRDAHKKDMENIFSSSNVPKESIYNDDVYTVTKGEKKKKPAPKAAGKKSTAAQQAPAAGFTKQYFKNGKCKVTFILPQAAAMDAQNVAIAGDFNNWDTAAAPMTRLKNGDFKATLSLDSNREYRFRYLIDGSRWENDWHADRYARNDFGSDDSVLVL
jgi:hypothetical protein